MKGGNMNMHGLKNIKCHLQQKYLAVTVAMWAFEVTEILTRRSTEEASFK